MEQVKVDPRRAARALAVTSWRRDYEGNPTLRKEAFEAEVVTLLDALKQGIVSLIGLLHDEQAINWGEGNSIRLTEEERRERIVDCRLNISNVGAVGVQYFPGIGEESSENFEMIRNGRYEYGWIYRGQSLSSSELAGLIIQHILEIGNGVVGYSVRRNPKLQLEEET